MTDSDIEALCLRPELPSPCYVIHEGLLQKNLDILDRVQRESGARIILALKGYAAFSTFPRIRKVLHGTTASSLHEARLGREEFGREVHVYAPAYKDDEFRELLAISDHIVFNSFAQWQRHRESALREAGRVSFGMRINPGYSEVKVDLYNPCRPGSRFGVSRAQMEGQSLEGLDGLHFHTLCEQNADTLERTLDVVLDRFGDVLRRMKWLNMGGGHHITRADYDVDLLIRCVRRVKEAFGLEVYLEPGEAVALNTGFLVCEVQDIVESGGIQVAILDTSATNHMPDVLEMPYRPHIVGAGREGEKPHLYRLGGLTCLAGDVIGDYAFDHPLEVGQRLIFTDMAIYSMVKNTTFNGVPLPSIAVYCPEGDAIEVVRRFGYEDYRNRLS